MGKRSRIGQLGCRSARSTPFAPNPRIPQSSALRSGAAHPRVHKSVGIQGRRLQRRAIALSLNFSLILMTEHSGLVLFMCRQRPTQLIVALLVLLGHAAQANGVPLVCEGTYVTLNERNEVTARSTQRSDVMLSDDGTFFFKFEGKNGGFTGRYVRTNRAYSLKHEPNLEGVSSAFSMTIDRTSGLFSSQTLSLFIKTGIVNDMRGEGSCALDEAKPLF